ncbi:sialate O-acetylesterase [Spirosoma soli]|uniref:Sialate O-acetylesterase n=1 Tax=Spirosoma soli TaxID=1770529 RepID=A0ABW5M463_9BACT
MLTHVLRIWLLVAGLLPGVSLAQLTISTPVPRMVFQRDLVNQASVLVAGLAPSSAITIEARFVPLAVNQGAVTPWTPLAFLPGSKAFRGSVTVSAGWYRLDVRAKSGSATLAQTQVNRVGVGEVFVVAGQSNAYGGFERVPGATEDRVSCLDFRQDSLSEQLLPLRFSYISEGTAIGPSQPPHLWGMLGDKLVQRLNVPVLFLGSALGGTSSTEWQQSAIGNIGTDYRSSVYRRLGVALLHYVLRTGARAVLWHQGETDIKTDNQTYFNNVKAVIDKSRQQIGNVSIPWMVSRASYINNETNPNVIAAQNRLIAELANVFPGPSTDDIIGPDNRPDNIHMKGPGLLQFTDRWNQSLSNEFFQNAVPFIPDDESSLITSGYTLPLTRRPGETIAVASLRSVPAEADNQFFAQIIRTSDGATVYESPRSNDNPLLVTLPNDLPDGSYQLRTLSTHPATAGTLGEPFRILRSAPSSGLLPVIRPPVKNGAENPLIQRFAYRYESGSHGFFLMVQADVQTEVRVERTDGGPFNDSGWNVIPPRSQAPDYVDFADFNYVRYYPPVAFAVGGVEPGRYRLSVRRQGDTGPGLSYEMNLIDGRVILYYAMEPLGAIPPVLNLNNTAQAICRGSSFNVNIEVTDGTLNNDNVFSVRLSDANGSFANETTIGSGSGNPVTATLPASLPAGNNYRLRVLASSPNVASAPSDPLTLCSTANNTADLSMALRVSTRTAQINQPVTLTLVLANSGPLPVNDVSVKSILPSGVDFVDAPTSAVSVNANQVNINAGTLPSGASAPFVFRLKANRSGAFATAAQITTSSVTDPDSQPNSGTGDGQDDAAQVDLRTSDGGGPLSTSPNPDQVPLPPVQSNQPPADPAKADLSLSLSSSQLTPQVSTPISLSLTVSNRGGATANNVTVQAQLPAGWQLTSTNGLGVNGQSVTGALPAISAGSSATLVLSVRPTGSATLLAQIQTATPGDSDSTPNNGYTNGEDDEATLTVRTR